MITTRDQRDYVYRSSYNRLNVKVNWLTGKVSRISCDVQIVEDIENL